MSFGALGVAGRALLYTRHLYHTTPVVRLSSRADRGRPFRTPPVRQTRTWRSSLFCGSSRSRFGFARSLGRLAPPDQLVEHVLGRRTNRTLKVGQRLGAAKGGVNREEVRAGNVHCRAGGGHLQFNADG